MGLSARFLIVGVILAACSASPAAGAGTLSHASPRAAAAPDAHTATLVQLTTPGAALSPALRAAKARLVSSGLNVWRLPAGRTHVLAALRAEGVLARAEPDRRIVPFSHLNAGDPLIPNEWWIGNVGQDRVEPPGPGVPVTIVDTGLDLSHPEFAGRPNTTLLNQQVVGSTEEIHGTAVSSIAAAPANGVGLVGVYPQAVLQEWDFDDGGLSEILAALDAASRRGRSVINFSGGFLGYSPLLERAVDRALRRGAAVVAAVGNDRQLGSRSFIPASLPHVLTVGATGENDRVAGFSSRSAALDVVAPGVAMPVAVPTFYDPSGYASLDGTSFAAPLVTGAAALIWTLRPQLDPTQLQDVIRDSARDVAPRGWDANTGFGIVSLPSALTVGARPKDPQEPNDDIDLVRPHAVTASGTRLTTPAFLRARLDVTEDPEDVYRIWIPAGARIAARTRSSANIDLALWGPRTKSVYEHGRPARRNLVAFGQKPGSRSDTVSGRNGTRSGAFYFVDVFLGKRVGEAAYSLKVSVARR
jgi:subtilase family protein